MSDALLTLEGGCLCGGVRYRVENALPDAAYCHCRLCQRSSGAPALPWASVAVERFRYIKGTPHIFASSGEAQREFCGICGSPLAFRKSVNARYVDFTVVTLDDPARLAPSYHIWRMSRLPWFETADRLPRYDDRGPDIFF